MSTNRAEKDQTRYLIDGFTDTPASATFFTQKVTQTDGSIKETHMSVAQYFQTVYRINLSHPNLPCVKTKKRGDIPIELCMVTEVCDPKTFNIASAFLT